ncbi:hypothetical protein GYMLUDRAFT_70326 [Collybiopsis luxurians FD-317 M1]|nr:hypothetical protein GYMLUDRAFT_70326 [Collybiopsis luxurians FD-317 M1]
MKSALTFPLHSGELPNPLHYTKHVKSTSIPDPLEPTNFVSLIRGFQPIHESLTIDPSLDIPFSQRPPLTQTERTEANRNNVNLKVSNAAIVADIHLVNRTAKGAFRREVLVPAKVYVRSDVGDITLRMHREESLDSRAAFRSRRAQPRTGPQPGQTPLKLSIRAGWGDVFLSIPRNFYGPLRITSKKIVGISPVLANGSLRTVKQSSCGMLFRTRECFVGKESSLKSVEEEEEEEEEDPQQTSFEAVLLNDEIIIEAKGGCVYLQYDDEVLGQSGFSSKCSFNSMYQSLFPELPFWSSNFCFDPALPL